jgi:hypothetical protein
LLASYHLQPQTKGEFEKRQTDRDAEYLLCLFLLKPQFLNKLFPLPEKFGVVKKKNRSFRRGMGEIPARFRSPVRLEGETETERERVLERERERERMLVGFEKEDRRQKTKEIGAGVVCVCGSLVLTRNKSI